MIGNVWEWTSSLGFPPPYHPEDGREDPFAPGSRILRGGAWDSGKWVNCTSRIARSPQQRDAHWGLRCAFDPH